MAFKINRQFRQHYDRIFRRSPETANLYLLMRELADDRGRVVTSEEELARLMEIRFNDPKEYALKGKCQ